MPAKVETPAGRTGRSVELRLEDLTKRFGKVAAVDRVDLVVPPGKLTALLGPSGCGKSTTLRMIAGFEAPSSGRVLLDNRDMVHVPPNRRNLGMVFQDYSLFPHMTVGENVSFGLRMAGTAREERDRRVRDILALVKLDGLDERYPNQLSGGQQQRTALARSLVMNPSVLLLDEPLGALDKQLRESMQFELRRIQQDLGITTVLVTHDQEEALTLADEIAVMNQGRILQVGSPHDIYEFPRTRFVSEFLGTANLIDVEPGEQAGEMRRARVVPSSSAEEVLVDFSGQSRTITIGIRPEKLKLSGSNENKNMNHIPATVDGFVFRGSYRAYSLTLTGSQKQVFVYEQADDRHEISEFRIGDPVWISWEPRAAFVFADEASGSRHA